MSYHCRTAYGSGDLGSPAAGPRFQVEGPPAAAPLPVNRRPQIPLYSKAGFVLIGPSDVVHGRDPWVEMAMELPAGGDAAEQE